MQRRRLSMAQQQGLALTKTVRAPAPFKCPSCQQECTAQWQGTVFQEIDQPLGSKLTPLGLFSPRIASASSHKIGRYSGHEFAFPAYRAPGSTSVWEPMEYLSHKRGIPHTIACPQGIRFPAKETWEGRGPGLWPALVIPHTALLGAAGLTECWRGLWQVQWGSQLSSGMLWGRGTSSRMQDTCTESETVTWCCF